MTIWERLQEGEFNHLSRWIANELGVDPERVEWWMYETPSGAHPVVTSILPTEKGQMVSNTNARVIATHRTSRDQPKVGWVIVPQDEQALERLGSQATLVGRGSWRGAHPVR